MNPEIRFRVQPEIYQLAEEKARELGLFEADAGRSAGVPLLARAAFYDWLGLNWPDQLPRPKTHRLQQLSEAPRAKLTVQHSWSQRYRLECLQERGLALPLSATVEFEVDPARLSRTLRRQLKLGDDGRLSGLLCLPELESDGELTLERLEEYLASSGVVQTKLDLGQWEQLLASWAQQNGSALLRARLEGGFNWLQQAENEWLEAKVRELSGSQARLEHLRAEQSLQGEPFVHTVVPDREPDLESMQLLRANRERAQGVPGLHLSLVRVQKVQIESRQRNSQEDYRALLWSLCTPAGSRPGVLLHL